MGIDHLNEPESSIDRIFGLHCSLVKNYLLAECLGGVCADLLNSGVSLYPTLSPPSHPWEIHHWGGGGGKHHD